MAFGILLENGFAIPLGNILVEEMCRIENDMDSGFPMLDLRSEIDRP